MKLNKLRVSLVFFVILLLTMSSAAATCNIVVITDPTGNDPNGAAAGSMSYAQNMFQSTFLLSRNNQFAVLSGGTGSSDTRLESIVDSIAFLENNLQEDGSIRIPEALRPYMGGISVIKAK